MRPPAIIFAILVTAASAHAQDTQPTTQESINHLNGHTQAIINMVNRGYTELDSLVLAGTISGTFEVAGETRQAQASFNSSYQSPNLFRHEIENEIVLAGTGKKIFGYQPKANAYIASEASADEKPAASDLPAAVMQILRMQDPSLLLAIVKEPGQTLMQGAGFVDAGQRIKLDGVMCEQLVVKTASPPRQITFVIDPQYRLIRQVVINLEDAMKKAGVPDVKKAVIKIDYTTIKPNSGDIKREQFAYSPPEGARDMAALHQAGLDAGEAATALVGKPAPDFSLQDLNGKTVTLAELKGSVVVLDFWATWCGPCVESLPHLDAIYRTKKDDGLKAFAINMREDKAVVQDFATRTGLTIPVLLNNSDAISDHYGVEGIPQTVVIGKDGVVKKVFVGSGIEEPLKAAINEAMK